MLGDGPAPLSRKNLAEGLARLLADSYAIYLKAHGYHSNVRGPNASQRHALFMAQYTEIWTAIDDVAERIRALGELAPQGYRAFANLSSIKDGAPARSAETMLTDLIDDHRAAVGALNVLQPTAQQAGDEVTASLISDRLAAHEKHTWTLGASL